MTTASTPEAIAVFRLLAVRGALKLESRGLKTRGGAIRPKWAKQLGLRPRDDYEVFIARVQELIDMAAMPAASPSVH